MKNIVFLIPRMGGGGAERVVSILANKFSKYNNVLIYTVTDSISFYQLDHTIRIEGAGYRVSKNKFLRPVLLGVNGIRFYFSFRKKMRKEKPDVVVSFLPETNIIASLQIGRKYKLILSERNDPTRRSHLIQKVIRALYRKTDVLVCQTKKVAEYYNFDNCVVIYNPVDCSGMPEVYNGECDKEIVAVGRLMPQKNFAMLIEAFSNVSAKIPEYHLKIYGDGMLRTTLQNKINELNMKKKIYLMGAKKNVIQQYQKAALFVMSSDYEGFPNALIESMAMGLPVICTDFATGVAREFIHEENGIVVPVGDVEKMSCAILELIGDSNRCQKAKAVNSKIRDTLGVDKIIKEWEQII